MVFCFKDFTLLQPGYLGKLLPDSAPTYPESLQQVLDGEISYLGF